MPSREDPDQAWARAEEARVDRLQVLLPDLVGRRVPARLVEQGPRAGVGRLRMADGTALLVTAVDPGALGRLLRAVVGKRPVVVATWSRTPEGLVLTLRGVPGRHPVRLLLVGLDQPD